MIPWNLSKKMPLRAATNGVARGVGRHNSTRQMVASRRILEAWLAPPAKPVHAGYMSAHLYTRAQPCARACIKIAKCAENGGGISFKWTGNLTRDPRIP